MLRLAMFKPDPGEKRVVIYVEQPYENVAKIYIGNPDINGTGETFQEAKENFKKCLQEYLNEFQQFCDNLDSEDPIMIDEFGNVIYDSKGTIWFTDKPMVEDMTASKEITGQGREVKSND